MYNLILQDFHLHDEDVLSIFPYGSMVYKTNSEISDYDFIVVSNRVVEKYALQSKNHNLNIHLYSADGFQDQLNRHKISALECYFLDPSLLLKNNYKFQFNLDKKILRSSISEKSSHSWVKAKKKFEVEVDKNIYIAKKSLFHSLRIVDFGLQIAQYGRINNYSSLNDIWLDIITDPKEDWNYFDNKFKNILNEKMSDFRKLAPK